MLIYGLFDRFWPPAADKVTLIVKSKLEPGIYEYKKLPNHLKREHFNELKV